MSYDFLGQMFGKARRRKIEAAAQQVLLGGQKPVAIDYGVLGTRLVAGVTAALLTATLNHSLPTTAGGILTVAGIGLTGALPTALKSSGLWTALSPDTLSAAEGLSQAITGVLAAPANARKAAFQQSLQSAVAQEVQAALEKTGSFQQSELGKSETGQNAAPEATSQQNGTGTATSSSTPAVGALVGLVAQSVTGGDADAAEKVIDAIAQASAERSIEQTSDAAIRQTGGNQ